MVDKKSKRKAIDTLKNEKNTKRLKQEIEAESSDEDIELDGMNEENDSDDSEEGDESILNEDEDEDEDEEGEEEDKEDEEEEEKVKPQQKDKKNKQQQQKKKMLNGKEAKQKKDKREQQQNEINIQSDQKTRVVEGGVQIKELKVGNGVFAKSGKLVSVYYVGRLKNGKKFDATTQGDGFKFRLGKGEVIKGWDVGIQGMKVGGKRQITIPPAMAYVLFIYVRTKFKYITHIIFYMFVIGMEQKAHHLLFLVIVHWCLKWNFGMYIKLLRIFKYC